MKLNRQRCAPLYLALLTTPLLSPFVMPVVRADEAEEAKAKIAADAKVNAAQDTIEKINALYLRARLAGQMKIADDDDWKSAETDINEAVRLVGEYEKDGKQVNGKSAVYNEQGYIVGNLNKYEEAITAYDKAEKAGFANDFAGTKNKGSSLWANRGVMKAKLYDFAGAIADYRASLAILDDGNTHEKLAEALYQKGDIQEAVAERKRASELGAEVVLGAMIFDGNQVPFNKAIFDNPGKAAPLIERAHYILKKMRADKTTDLDPVIAALAGSAANDTKANALVPALEDLARAIKVEPKSPVPLIERGRMRLVYMSLHSSLMFRAFKFEDTLKDFQKALTLDPKNAEAWFELGLTRIALAKEDSEKVLAILNPKEGTAKREAALKGARSDLSRAIYFKPNTSGEVRFQRANIERQLPKPDINALFIDYSAAIEQNFVPLNAEWHALIAPTVDAPDPTALSEAHMMRGRILLSRGQLATGLADFDAALAAKEDNLSARFERGKLRVQRGDYNGALEDLSRAVKDNPKSSEIWLWRGVAYDGKGDTEKAKADLKEAIARDAKIADRIKGSRYDEANPNPNRGLAPPPRKDDLKIVPPGTALDHKNAGNELRGKGDMEGALNEYNLALIIDPNFADALNNRANVYYSRGEVDLALADYNRALEIDPKHRVAYLLRASVWQTLGEPEKQGADLEHAIEFADNDDRKAAAYSQRAQMWRDANDVKRALEDAKRATELAPKSGDAWETLGRIQLDHRDNADAITSFRRAIAEDAGNLSAHVNLSITLGIGDAAEAVAEFEQVIRLAKPDDLLPIANSVQRAFDLHPQSAALKTMRNRVVSAMPKAGDANAEDDEDDVELVF